MRSGADAGKEVRAMKPIELSADDLKRVAGGGKKKKAPKKK